jgi:levansucrase
MNEEFAPGFGAASGWSREQAARIERTPETVAPIIYPPESDPAPHVHVWDTWLCRERDGSIATIDGWRVILSLTASSELLPGKRHDVAEIRAFASRDGRDWHDVGPVFDGGALGSRQWAGSALYEDGSLTVFYTAAGHAGEHDLTYDQQIAAATGGRIAIGEDGPRIEGSWRHEVILEPDGERYETSEQTRGMIYTFRDPWFFEDGDQSYLLFEANTPVPEGADACDEPVREEFNGSIGLARSPSGDRTEWVLEEPIVDAVCTNQELERPHVIVRDGSYYLFVSSHLHTFAPGLAGFDALYGFVGESLRGPYRPLNGSGLVATNPENAPYQAYSWLVYPHREELLATSFFNYYDLGSLGIDDVGRLPEDEQKRRFGGSLAPTLRIGVDGDRTEILGALDHGHLPLPSEELPERLLGERSPSGYGAF